MSEVYRGIFDFIDDPRVNIYRDIEWERWVKNQNAPYGVPRYKSREECFEAYKTIPRNQTNSVVSSWEFLDNVVLNYVSNMSEIQVSMDTNDDTSMDLFDSDLSMCELNIQKIDKLKQLSPHEIPDVRETARWIYNTLRCGILVAIKYGKIVCFCPFYNESYENSWPQGFPRGSENFKQGLPVRNWWANGGILCTEKYTWGTHFCMQIRDLLAECASKYLSNCPGVVFFVNKRDSPQYKYNEFRNKLGEPYGFIYDADDHDPFQDIPLLSEPRGNVCPMLSFYGGERFLDLLIPTTEDWEASSRNVYLPDTVFNPLVSITSVRDLSEAIPEQVVPLNDKRGVAFFRGSATGSGTNVFSNQRLRLFSYAQSVKNPLLDVKCTSLRQRLHKHYLEPVSTIDRVNFPVSEHFYTPMSDQRMYKYLIYVEGHCAACRLGMMLSFGSVILKVESSTVASELWFTSILRETSIDESDSTAHVITIRKDLTNLIETVTYLEEHPVFAQQIATNARNFWDLHLNRDSVIKNTSQTLFALI